MWPWEHLGAGYLLYSATTRAIDGRSPTDDGALVLAIGTQFPDLVDKPGSWVFGVLPSGTSVAHSVFVAVSVTFVTVLVTRERGVPELGIAFGVGYLSHLFGDVLYPVLLGGEAAFGAVLWPFGPAYAGHPVGVAERVSGFLTKYVDYLVSPVGIGYLALEVALLVTALAVWLADGTPGSSLFHRLRNGTREWIGRS